MTEFTIFTVDSSNIEAHGMFCVKNKKHPGYVAKREWLRRRFKEGLRFKQIIAPGDKLAGFLEYIPGEYTWRVVEARGYLVIHCLWVESKKSPYKGMASALLDACMDDARSAGKKGVTVVASDGPWMVGKSVFIKNGFEQVDETPPHFQLLAKRIGSARPPTFPTDWDKRLFRRKSLQLLYTDQCPFIGKAVRELPPVAKRYGTRLRIVEIKSAAEARKRFASPYGMFNLVHDGRLLADHAISATRFKNILERELNLTHKT
ncbi:MAG: hypothetical protein JSW50_05405 [Candidatus Latescibacterota bacterium]|nr:MAG: hypothetical protein JSW50_05405 [Candidatus Latescibacterota bacterium]